ncbi:restriction endonuclease subunit S [Lactococcus petauri]|uniref:restriction endonuclease subunit S n=1 Tax=Lactococcus petauri TaxID=1940789 RepID=UPI001F058748|nr:restriction endonuclease subunit S [Lactococcus petauri]MCH1712410.1 restriction endonuclease subunit S [Lactococcus petauri]
MNDKNLDSQKSKLKEMKKAPELRFKGFSDDWEQRKFKDFSKKTGKKNSKDLDLPAYSVSNKSGLISQTEQFDGSRLDSLEKTSYKFVEPNEFAYNPARINVGSIAFNNLGMAVIVSSLYVVVKMSEDLDNGFILQFIKSPTFIKEVKRNTEGSVREYLFYENFANIKFPFAKNKEEQQKIGIFFQQLDETIVLHQRKLEKLKQLKLAYLQQLFPKSGGNISKIRFAYFEDVWEQRKSKELCTISTGKGNTQDRVDDGTYPFYVRSATIEKSDEYLYDQEAVLTVGDGVGTGKVFHYVNGKYNLHQRVYRMYNFKEVSAKYFYYYFSKNFYKRVMSMTAKTSVDSVRMEMIADMNIFFPSVKEQEKIVELFSNLDKTIALHQEKLNQLKTCKKALLQKIFN